MTTDAKQFALLTQQETNYTPVSTAPGAACSSCRWFKPGWDGNSDACQLVENWPDPIVPNGWCVEHREYVQPPAEPLEVAIVDDGSIMGIEVESGQRGLKHAMQRVFKSVIDSLFPSTTDLTGFKVLPGNRWVGVFTNNFEDREGELFTEKAIDRFIANVKAGVVPYPELWLWHLPGTKHGQADSIWRLGHFAVASGTFDDTPLAHKLRDSYQRNPLKAMSHGFLFAPKWRKQTDDGLVYYDDFVTFEISPLSKKWAANAFTDFVDRMKVMNIPDDTRRDVVERLGEKDGNAIINAALAAGKNLETLMRSKLFTDTTGETTPPDPVPPPAPPPTEPTPTPPTPDPVPAPVVDNALKSQVDALTEQNKSLSGQITMLLNANAGVPVLVKQVETLEGEKQTLTAEITTLKAKLAGFEELGVRPTRAPETTVKPDESVVGKWLQENMKKMEDEPAPTGLIWNAMNTSLGGM